MNQLVVKYASKRNIELGDAAYPGHAVIKTRSRKAERARELSIENRRVVDHHLDPTPWPQPQVVIQMIVGAFELCEDLLLEAPGAVEAGRPIDVDVLIELEVR